MRRRAYLTCALLVAALAVAGSAAVAGALDGRPIREIRFSGLERLAEETLRFYLGVEEGKPYDEAAVNGKIHDLWGRQLIDDIEVVAEELADGVALSVRVVERPVLRSIEYQGLKRVSRTDVVERISKDRLRVREGDSLNLGELRRLQAVIEDLYEEKGFRLAKADFTIERVSAGDRKVIFTVDEGDKVRIEDIDFEGNTVFGDRRLRWVMDKTKESGFITRLFKKDIYKSAAIEEDLEKVREIYRKAGYKNVVLGEPRIDVQARRPGAETLKEQKRRLFLTIPVEEGTRWKLGEITINGNDRFSDEVLLRQFKRPRGGWLRSNAVGDGIEAIRELYQNTGHLFAQVQPEIKERGREVADLLVYIDEGDQFSVGRIEFEGNTKTRDKVLRREMGIQEGMVLNSGALRNSLLRIRQLEFFRVDEEDPVAFEFDNEAKTVDLQIKGEEGDRTELMFGGGFSEIDGFFGQFQFRSRNFLGRGETLGVSIQSGRRQDVFDLSYLVPWFLDKPQSVGLQLFNRKLDFSLFTGQALRSSTRGATLTYGRNLSLFRSISTSYSRYDQEDEQRRLVGGQLVDSRFERDVSTVRLAHVFDKRDSRLQPTVGYRYSTTLEYAGGFLGGSTSFIRPQTTFTLYKPLTKQRMKTVAAFNLELGYIEPFGGRDLFFLDRFYLGGESSMRGFRFRSIWVRDDAGNTLIDNLGFPLGGDKFLQLNLEYIFLVGGPFRVLLFGDAGNVFAEFQDYDLGNLRYTAGVELQINVPIFGAPLRFIYAFNLEPFPDDRFETFQFSVGPSF